MSAQWIAWLPDESVRELLIREEPTVRERVHFSPSPAAVIAELRQQRTPRLLIDVRQSLHDESGCAIVQAIMDGIPGVTTIQLVVIGDEAYPRQYAGVLWSLSGRHITWNSDESVREVHQELSNPQPGRAIPVRKCVTAGDLELMTYQPSFAATIEELQRVVHRNVTLLLIGETGTGKTTLARFVHNASPRSDRGFQHMACGALPGDLIESELFGHTRGAFTGAERNKLGRFQAAGRGTLLLDEIDVLDLKQQVKLLRVIETGEYELVGSTETRISEARLIVASNVDLEEMTERQEFRSDLYYRLNMLEFKLPALRDRLPDLIPLALRFIEESCQEHQIAIDTIERDFLNALLEYSWPGNLRELKNHMRRAVLFSNENRLAKCDLSPKVLHAVRSMNSGKTPGRSTTPLPTIAEQMAHSEREVLQHTLAIHGQNRTRTAEALGLSRVGLYKKLKRLGLMSNS